MMPDFEPLRALVAELVREELAKVRAPEEPDLVTVAAFARRRSISEGTVRAAIKDGRLAATRFGRAVRIAADAQIARVAPANAEAKRAARLGLLLGGRPTR